MRNFYCLLLVLCGWVTTLHAQDIKPITGVVKDSASNKPLEKAVVSYVETGKKDTARVLTNLKGEFTINKIPAGEYILMISYVGYQTVGRRYPVEMTGSVGTIEINPKVHELDEVVIEAPAIRVAQDTIEYRASAYKVKQDAVVEDLLKKLPGVEVDKTGAITAHGQTVTKVRVNGKPFFSNDPKMVTKNLPAEMIDKVQIIDDQSDQAKFSGFDDGEREKIINITIKKDKNYGYFGNATVGAGTDSRYLASLRGFNFSDDRQIAVVGNSNNNNNNSFTVSDAGFQSAGGKSSGGSGQTGINKANSISGHFANQYGQHVSLDADYSYTHNDKEYVSSYVKQYKLPSLFYNTQDQLSNLSQGTHSANFNLGYRFSKHDSLRLSPTFSYNDNQQVNSIATTALDSIKSLTQSGMQNYSSYSKNPNISGNLIWMHNFNRKGRSLSVNLGTGYVPKNETDNNYSITQNYTLGSLDTLNQLIDITGNNKTYKARASYTEPLGKTTALEFSYNFNASRNYTDREQYDLTHGQKTVIDSLTNEYTNTLYTHKAGVTFMQKKAKYNYQLGVSLQPTILNSVTERVDTVFHIHYTQNAFVPTANFNYQFSRNKRLQFNYNGTTTQPSISQLQPITDNTNQLYKSIGNPNLKPQFNNNFRLRYNNFNMISGQSFFVNLSATVVGNNIVNSTVIDASTSAQTVKPVNVSGYYTTNANYNYSIPFQNRTYVVNYGGNIAYTNDVSLLQDERNIGHVWNGSQKLRLEFNKDWMELMGSASYNLTHSSYTLDTSKTSNYGTWEFDQTTRFDIVSNLTFLYDFTYTINNGLSSGIGKNVALMNATVEARILKKQGIIRLSVNDLFDQNTSITRSVTSSYTQDTRTNVLTRYFMLSFTWKFQKFAGIRTTGDMNFRRGGPGGGGGGGGRGGGDF